MNQTPSAGTPPRRPRLRRRTAVLAAVAAAALALTACSSSSAPTPQATAAYELTAQTPAAAGPIDSFTWSLYAEPASLAYPYAFDYPSNTVLSNVCDSLLRWNPDLSLAPGLATSWSAPTPTTWVYELRDGVTFHDGTTMTADDVVASLSEHLNPAIGSYWYSVFQNVTLIEKTGPMEVTVTSSKPDALFNNYMAATPGTVESAATLTADGANYGNPTTGVNCSGPFTLDSWVPGQSITLKKYDNYWDKSLVAKANEVKFVFLQDPTTRVNAWTTGEVDGGWQVPSNAISSLQSSGAGKVYFGVNTEVTSEIVNNMSGPLGNVKVRQALLMAIDRKGIIAAGENGYAQLTNALAPESAWGTTPQSVVDQAYTGLKTYDYDVAAAKQLVADAGVSGQSITIATSPISSAANITAQAVAAAATAIGLVPTIQTVSPDQYSALFSDPTARKGIDLFLTNWYLSSADPQEMFSILQTGQASNYGSWSDADFDSTVSQAIGTPDATARGELSVKAQQITNDQLPWLPLYTTPTTVWLNNRITGVSPSIDFLYYPWAATIGAAQ